MQFGLERCLAEPPSCLKRARIGLLMNQASVDRQQRLACERFAERFGSQLVSIFSPQHGIWGEQQANMIETGHAVYQPLNLPVYSLYSETRRPTAQMLDAIDVLVIDLQDVGTRVYTFVWTMLECLHACAEAGKSVLVLDRPNPIGGQVIEGPALAAGFESFVGGAGIEMRHGLTIAELAGYLVDSQSIDVDLQIIPLSGWDRTIWADSVARPWVWPSPNMPTLATTILYPGQVLLEGVNLSEGRGTTRPFELVGAPFVDTDAWMELLRLWPCAGLEFVPVRFLPTFDKWQGESCGGIELRVVEPEQVRSLEATVAILASAAALWPKQFGLLDPPYEYETEKPPIDILWGSDLLRKKLSKIQSGESDWRTASDLITSDTGAWKERTERSRLY